MELKRLKWYGENYNDVMRAYIDFGFERTIFRYEVAHKHELTNRETGICNMFSITLFGANNEVLWNVPLVRGPGTAKDIAQKHFDKLIKTSSREEVEDKALDIALEKNAEMINKSSQLEK